MIKLFWNTHNETAFDTEKINKINVTSDYGWGIYHKNNSDKWIYNILSKIEFDIIQNEKDLEKDDIVIIVDSNVERKNELYTKLKLICSKLFLVHLGDESGIYDVSSIYNNFNLFLNKIITSNYLNF